MISRIELRHFKCFRKLAFGVRPLTLLSGGNASGKSSVMQALVLLHQTMREQEWSSRLMLNGETVRLGTCADVIDQVYGRHSCDIALIDGDDEFRWTFAGGRDELSMEVDRTRGETEAHGMWNIDGSDTLRFLVPVDASDHSLLIRLRRLTYLTAERLGPREYYPYNDPQLTPVVGSKGEYAVSMVYSGRDERVLPGLMDGRMPPRLLRQVEARMGAFFPGFGMDLAPVMRANAVTLGMRTSRDADFHRPVHTGFGITQVLPIVISVLSAQLNDVLLIENPEVHLHPAGQSRMGEFLAEAANTGVQVIIETHSDHVLNGIRRAVKKGALSPDNVAFYFFRPRQDVEASGVEQVDNLSIDAEGNLDDWPEGFFDQFDRDMSVLAGWN